MEQVVSKSQFKPRALQYFREVQEKGLELIITDHGKPVLLKNLKKLWRDFETPLSNMKIQPNLLDWRSGRL
jgi:hypothetical protein